MIARWPSARWLGFGAALLLGAQVVSAPAQTRQPDPYLQWARVLERFVDDRGEVDFHRLAGERTDLDAFLGYVARVGPRTAPESFSGRDAALAYYLNAYNALSMFNVIDSGFPESLGGLTKLWFFGIKRFPVDRERTSLYSLENDVIRPLADERVHFALNCMSVGCPRLPRVPFRAVELDRQLDGAARGFFGESRNLQVVPDRKLVRVSSILKFYSGDFLAKSPTLIDYINKYATQSIPGDYRIEFIDYDWTVNDQRSRIGARWEAGYTAARRMLERRPWRQAEGFLDGIIVHDEE